MLQFRTRINKKSVCLDHDIFHFEQRLIICDTHYWKVLIVELIISDLFIYVCSSSIPACLVVFMSIIMSYNSRPIKGSTAEKKFANYSSSRVKRNDCVWLKIINPAIFQTVFVILIINLEGSQILNVSIQLITKVVYNWLF